MNKPAAKKVLIVGPTWVGDMVMSQVLYRVLAQTRPGVTIDVLAPAWSAPVLQRMPEVRNAISLPLARGEVGWGKRRALGRLLKKEGYQQAILLPNSLKSALVPFFAGIEQRTGWRGEFRYGLLNDLRILDPVALPLMVERFAALGLPADASLSQQFAEGLPAPKLQVDTSSAQSCREKFALDAHKPILALCPGAEFGSAKRWPAEYYGQLASKYLSRGWQVVLFGSANDQPVTAEIYRACNSDASCFDLAGKTQLAEVIDLLSLCDAVVSNDSGLMHIAAALARPLLAVYGPTSPGFTPPLNDNAAMVVSDIDCAPCFQRECPLGHHRCMRDALPAQLADKLDLLLQGNKEP